MRSCDGLSGIDANATLAWLGIQFGVGFLATECLEEPGDERLVHSADELYGLLGENVKWAVAETHSAGLVEIRLVPAVIEDRSGYFHHLVGAGGAQSLIAPHLPPKFPSLFACRGSDRVTRGHTVSRRFKRLHEKTAGDLVRARRDRDGDLGLTRFVDL